MKAIIITGSTRGIGFGLAEQFLARGCQVLINGRSAQGVQASCAQLVQKYGADRIAGQAGDVTKFEDHRQLWKTAVSHFGKVDIWINNAGIGHAVQNAWELPPETVEKVIDIDLKGVVFGSQVALKQMLAQGFGHLYNMEGFGSDGRTQKGFSIYGSTKRGLRFFTRVLILETKETAVKVSTLSPGIVLTDFIFDQYQDDPEGLEKSKPIFNILADKLETVTPWLAERVLANEKSGAKIAWLTPGKVIYRFLTARFVKRDLFA